MPNIEATTHLDASPEKVFSHIDFFGDASWIPGTARVVHEGSGVGAVRTVTTVDGVRIVERLESHEVTEHRYRYAIVEAPMPADNYLSTVEVTPEGGGSRVRWSAEFDAAPEVAQSLEAALTGLFESALAGLKSRLG